MVDYLMTYKPGLYIQTLTADKTLVANDEVVLCDTAQSISILTLPATHLEGKSYQIRNIGNSNLTVARNGNKIDGIAVDFILSAGDSIILTGDGTDWWSFSTV